MPLPPPPGYRSTVAGLAVGQILSWAALFYAFSTVVLPMQHELHWDKSTLMGALTLGQTVWAASAYAVGAAIDRGHGRTVMSLGAALAAVGVAAWSMVDQPWMLYAAWLVLGAAMAMTLYDPAFNVLTRRFPQHYLRGITTLTLVGGFASTLAFPLMAALIHWGGWRDALRVLAVVLAVVVLPLHGWALRGAAGVTPAAVAAPRADATLRAASHSPAFWLLITAFTLFNFGAAAVWAHVMPIFAAKGFDELQATAVVVWIGPAQVLGRLGFAWLGGRWPLRWFGFIVLVVMPISLLLLGLSAQPLALAGFALLFGVSHGLVTVVRGAIVPEFFGRSHVGRIAGAMTSVGLLARAAAPLGAAWMLLWLGGYTAVLVGLAALGFAAVAAFALARAPRRS